MSSISPTWLCFSYVIGLVSMAFGSGFLLFVDICFIIFFFSSRRRHTRSLCDWSSDVCSSDLVKMVGFDAGSQSVLDMKKGDVQALVVQNPMLMGYLGVMTLVKHLRGEKVEKRIRSEERRVGKECRYRRSAEHEKKKEERMKVI